MAEASTTAVKGLAELDRLLKQLPVNIEVNVLRGAMRAGQKVVQAEAQAKAPVKSGELRRSIKVKANAGARRRGYARVDVEAGGKMAWYARLLHTGTGAHYRGTGTRSVRKAYIIKARGALGTNVDTKTKRRLSRRHGDALGLLLPSGQLRSMVTHPGIRPNDYMRDAALKLDGPALEAFVAYLQRRLPHEIRKLNPAASAS